MLQRQNQTLDRNFLYSWMFFFIALFFSYSKALRFGFFPFGLGEVLVSITFVGLVFYDHRGLISSLTAPISKFWMVFLFSTTLGLALSRSPLQPAKYDAMAYAYNFVLCLVVLTLLRYTSGAKLRKLLFWSIVSFSFLAFLGLVVMLLGLQTLFDALLIQAKDLRYSAWATNPNQLAFFLLPFPVFLIGILSTERVTKLQTFFAYSAMFACIFTGFFSRSDALLLSWSVMLVALPIVNIAFKARINYKLFLAALISFTLSYGTIKYLIDGDGRRFTESLAVQSSKKTVFTELPQSNSQYGIGFDQNKIGVRQALWAHAYQAWKEQPLFGNGPGAFAYIVEPSVKMEAHNLFLDIASQGGIIAMLALLGLVIYTAFLLFKKKDVFGFVNLALVMLFSMAHFMLRQPAFSLFFIFALTANAKNVWTNETVSKVPQKSS